MAVKKESRRPAPKSPSDLPRGADPAGQGQAADEVAAAKQISREEIARRAYERYEKRGRQPGHDQEDWFHAEQELKGGGGRAGGHQG